MISTKPRIIKIDGFWYVTRQSEGNFCYSLGVGDTPQQAWSNAFPESWWRRILN